MNRYIVLIILTVCTVITIDYFTIDWIVDNESKIDNKNQNLTKGDCIVINTEITKKSRCDKPNRYNGQIYVVRPLMVNGSIDSAPLIASKAVVRCDQYENVVLTMADKYPNGTKYPCYYNQDKIRFKRYDNDIGLIILALLIVNLAGFVNLFQMKYYSDLSSSIYPSRSEP